MLMDEGRELDFSSPELALAGINEALRIAVGTSKHAWHLMTIANINRAGEPDARTVVLRGYDPSVRQFRFHTDWRSPKVADMIQNPALTLLLYDPVTRWQLRIPARATIHHRDEVTQQAWLKSLPTSRVCYALPDAPSTILHDRDWPAVPATPDPSDEAAYTNFCVVVCSFDVMEVLVLRAVGHRRMRLEWSGTELRGHRVAP